MPELPEVEALTRFLDEKVAGRRVARCVLASFAALKTVDPPLDTLEHLDLLGCRRRGKYICFQGERAWLVVHLARGGWVHWRDAVPSSPVRPGRGPLALRVVLEPGRELERAPGFDISEMGTEKRLALWMTTDPDALEPLASLGADPLDPAVDVPALGRLLASEPGTVKNALSRQSLLAGIGNAYSDEILHAARLSPFRAANRLSPAELERLHGAMVGVLTEAVARSSGLAASELKGDKKRAMAVHGRTGEACPVCGDVIREVSFASRSLQYCATCQTGGRPLADRRLSRLLR